MVDGTGGCAKTGKRASAAHGRTTRALLLLLRGMRAERTNTAAERRDRGAGGAGEGEKEGGRRIEKKREREKRSKQDETKCCSRRLPVVNLRPGPHHRLNILSPCPICSSSSLLPISPPCRCSSRLLSTVSLSLSLSLFLPFVLLFPAGDPNILSLALYPRSRSLLSPSSPSFFQLTLSPFPRSSLSLSFSLSVALPRLIRFFCWRD